MVTFSNKHSRKWQEPNLQHKKVYWEEGQRWVKLRICTKAIKTIEKVGGGALRVCVGGGGGDGGGGGGVGGGGGRARVLGRGLRRSVLASVCGSVRARLRARAPLRLVAAAARLDRRRGPPPARLILSPTPFPQPPHPSCNILTPLKNGLDAMAKEAGIDLWKLPFEDARPERLAYLEQNKGKVPQVRQAARRFHVP